MSKTGYKLSELLRFALIPLLGIIVVCALRLCGLSANTMIKTGYGIKMLIIEAAAVICATVIIISNAGKRKKLAGILGIALVLRLLWIIFVPSTPVSDYNTMHHCAKAVVGGDFSGMKGSAYFSRYPHLTVSVMYMSLIRLIFGNGDIWAMKIVSVILSVVNVWLIYKISEYFVKNDKFRLVTALIAAVFPPFVTYVSTFCTENQAMPLLLGAILYFCRIINGNASKKNVILCGLLLGGANLFRGVAAIVAAAMFISLCLCAIKHKVKIMCAVIAVMMAITAVISCTLLVSGITEAHIWNGKESGITYFLKGLNVESKGAWNKEDAEFVEEHFLDEDFNSQCIDIIKERLSQKTPSELFSFFLHKFTNQWSYGDCGGSYWAFMDTGIKYRYPIDIGSQLFGSIILIFAFISLLTRKNNCSCILHLLLCGFGLFFLIFETQPRYAYIASWVFVFMASQGFEQIYNYIHKTED